jgi:hypothetical protein
VITLISSSSYTLDDLLPYYSVFIEKAYSNGSNLIVLTDAAGFSLKRNTATGSLDLHFYIRGVADDRQEAYREKVALGAYVVRFT